MDELAAAFVAVMVFVLAISMTVWHFSRSRKMVEQWAHANGLTLIEVERRFMFRGPFWWRTGRGQEVFRVTVRDGAGQVRSGYVRVGGWCLGLWSDQVDVKWDK